MTIRNAGRIITVALTGPFLLCACEASSMLGSTDLPPGKALPVATRITFASSFMPSGAASTGGCDVVLVGSGWGTLIRIGEDGTVESRTGRLPAARMGAVLDMGPEGTMLAHTNDRPFLGRIDRDFNIDSIPVPPHPWGFRSTGPTAVLPNAIAMASIGDLPPRKTMGEPWGPAPLAVLIDSTGVPLAPIGHIQTSSGEFLSWLEARTVVGARADTVLLLNLGEGVVTAWREPYEEPEWVDTLPRYFARPAPREELWRYPWLQYGGMVRNLISASHVAAAGFAGDGTLYAIRNHRMRWQKREIPHLDTQGNWVPEEQALEVYSHRGELIERYDLSNTFDFLSVANVHRVFLGGNGEVLVLDFAQQSGGCPRLPGHIIVEQKDAPPIPAHGGHTSGLVGNSPGTSP